ncbi:MAG: hypothetical protein GC155_04000 [Alphaproteobacteria bacterium]|nr:hypothetical protein [Alphaproteobacteria bacterium]
MTRRILVELVLFLLPFAVFYVYRAASRDLSVRDRWPLTALIIAGAVFAIAALVAGPLLAPSQKGKCYLAARYENGVTIPAKEVDCKAPDATAAPDKPAPPPTPPPVAPRDLPSAASQPPPPVQKLPSKTPDKPPEGLPEIPAPAQPDQPQPDAPQPLFQQSPPG